LECSLPSFAVEKEDMGFHPLRVEDAGGQAQQGMSIGLFEEFAANGLLPAFPGQSIYLSPKTYAERRIEGG
jgi:hypothetical protein